MYSLTIWAGVVDNCTKYQGIFGELDCSAMCSYLSSILESRDHSQAPGERRSSWLAWMNDFPYDLCVCVLVLCIDLGCGRAWWMDKATFRCHQNHIISRSRVHRWRKQRIYNTAQAWQLVKNSSLVLRTVLPITHCLQWDTGRVLRRGEHFILPVLFCNRWKLNINN